MERIPPALGASLETFKQGLLYSGVGKVSARHCSEDVSTLSSLHPGENSITFPGKGETEARFKEHRVTQPSADCAVLSRRVYGSVHVFLSVAAKALTLTSARIAQVLSSANPAQLYAQHPVGAQASSRSNTDG